VQVVYALKKRGSLTDQQVLAAYKFSRRPYDFKLSPSLFRVLRELIVDEMPIEVFEKRRGWPARSAKQCLRLLLDSLIEVDGDRYHSVAEVDEEADAVEKLEYVTASDAAGLLLTMRRHGLTMIEAKFVLALDRAPNRTLSKEGLMRRLYDDRSTDEMPATKVLDVHLSHVRPKLKGVRIATIQGMGYQLIREGEDGYEDAPEGSGKSRS